MSDYLVSYLLSIKDNWLKKSYAKAVGYALLFGVTLLLLGFLIAYIIMIVLNFIVIHFDTILLASCLFSLGCYLIKEHYVEKNKVREQQAEEKRVIQEQADQAILDQNYKLLGNCLFKVINDLYSILKLKQPHDVHDMYTHHRYLRKGNYIVYQYIVYSTADIDDVSILKRTLQAEITRSLELKSFDALGQTYYIHNGRSYPIITVESVDLSGVFYTISLVITEENYCRCIEQGISASLLNQTHQLRNTSDVDF